MLGPLKDMFRGTLPARQGYGPGASSSSDRSLNGKARSKTRPVAGWRNS